MENLLRQSHLFTEAEILTVSTTFKAQDITVNTLEFSEQLIPHLQELFKKIGLTVRIEKFLLMQKRNHTNTDVINASHVSNEPGRDEMDGFSPSLLNTDEDQIRIFLCEICCPSIDFRRTCTGLFDADDSQSEVRGIFQRKGIHIARFHKCQDYRSVCPYCGLSVEQWHIMCRHFARSNCGKLLITSSELVVFAASEKSDVNDDMEVDTNASAHIRKLFQWDTVCSSEIDTATNAQFASKLVLELQSEHRMSERLTDDVVRQLCAATKRGLNIARAQCSMFVNSTDKCSDMALSFEKNGDQLFYNELADHFKAIDQQHKRAACFRNQLGFVEPETVCMNPDSIDEKLYCQVIPFLESFFVVMRNIEPYMLSCASRDDGLMRNLNHGELVSGLEPLGVILYTDDAEIANPLGSAKAQNYNETFYFWSLASLKPQYRSLLSSINVLAICPGGSVKEYGHSIPLQSFIEGIQKLQNGLIFSIGADAPRLTKATLYAVIGDALALNCLSGNKRGFKARHFCRMCMVSQEETREIFSAKECPKRDIDNHQRVLAILEDPHVSEKDKEMASKESGIVCRSPLLQIENFPFFQGFLQDPMHMVLEGILSLIVALLCDRMVVKGWISASELSLRIMDFDYSKYCRRNKPALIKPDVIKGATKHNQKAAQLRTLALHFALIFHDVIPTTDIVFKIFSLSVQMMVICHSPVADNSTCQDMESLVKLHHTLFLSEFKGQHFIPKMHFMVHMGDQIRYFGPPRFHSAIRFEGKIGQVKAKKYKNFKNLPKTIAYDLRCEVPC